MSSVGTYADRLAVCTADPGLVVAGDVVRKAAAWAGCRTATPR
ncbi:hypothetical protein [Streptomyces sp. 2132.2]|nr:hypothetical protein [Streptomyces sp. 2132.2]